MADERLKITLLTTGNELYYMSKEGVLHCIVAQKQGLTVQVQNIDRPREKLWLTASQVEFECTTKQEMDTPDESMLDEEDKEELQSFKGNELLGFKGNEFRNPFGTEEDDPADWWKKGKKD